MTNNDGNKIIRLIELLGITQKEFSERIGLNTSTVSSIKNNKSKLTDRTKKLIEMEFKVSIEWLENGNGEPFINNSSELDIIEKVIYHLKNNDEKASCIKRILCMEAEELIMIKKIIDIKNEHCKKRD